MFAVRGDVSIAFSRYGYMVGSPSLRFGVGAFPLRVPVGPTYPPPPTGHPQGECPYMVLFSIMRKNIFYILCGLPFSGKTTLASKLVSQLNLSSINLDAINGLFGVGLDGAAITPEEWDRTYIEAYRQIGEALATGHSVLFDATNFTRQQRDLQRAIATRYNVPSQVIYMDVSEEEARQRWQQNRVTHQRHDVRDEDFEQVVRNFESPTEDEQVIRYNQSMPFDGWLHHNFTIEV